MDNGYPQCEQLEFGEVCLDCQIEQADSDVCRKNRKRNKMNSTISKALLVIDAVKNELAMGTKHYRASTMQPLSTELEILKALYDKDLMIEPTPERQGLFQKETK